MHRRIACFATQGTGSQDEARVRALLGDLDLIVLPFDRSRKAGSLLRLVREILRHRPALVVMEGTGFAGGLAVLTARFLRGVPYVVSSGDAIAPFARIHAPALFPFAGAYERVLCAASAGFIGWSPYIVGRALTLGAPRAMTAANWAPTRERGETRAAMRARLGIAQEGLVFGLVGSLEWTSRVEYCYGLELVRAAVRAPREDLFVLIVGDGAGREKLEAIARESGRDNVILPGAVPRDEIPSYLGAMDVASLPQSVDGVGSFRYTTKLSEYLAAGLPIVTGQIPLAYDLDDGWLWRLPGEAPWGDTYIDALARLMASMTAGELDDRASRVPALLPVFSKERQQRQVRSFVLDILASESRSSS